MSGRRLDVTATQAVSSMLAALTGAIAASGLGIAGTIIGAAFMSLAGTVGAAIYKHYLARSRERLRAAATSLAPKAETHPAAAAVLRHTLLLGPEETARLRPDGQAVVAARVGEAGPERENPPAVAETRVDAAVAGLARRDRAAAGAPAAFTKDGSAAAAVAADIAAAVLGERTTLGHESLGYTAAEHPVTEPATGSTTVADRPPAGEPGPTARLRVPGARNAADLASAPTAALAAADGEVGDGLGHGASGGGASGGGAADGDRPPGAGGESRSRARPRRRWLLMAAAVLGTFVVAMSAVTAVEAIAGKPLENLIWGRSGSGTTIGSVVEHHASPRPATVPGTSSTPSQSPSARPGSTSPRPATTSPSPTPSTSVSSSSGTSPTPSSSPTASSGTGSPSAPTTSPAG